MKIKYIPFLICTTLSGMQPPQHKHHHRHQDEIRNAYMELQTYVEELSIRVTAVEKKLMEKEHQLKRMAELKEKKEELLSSTKD